MVETLCALSPRHSRCQAEDPVAPLILAGLESCAAGRGPLYVWRVMFRSLMGAAPASFKMAGGGLIRAADVGGVEDCVAGRGLLFVLRVLWLIT